LQVDAAVGTVIAMKASLTRSTGRFALLTACFAASYLPVPLQNARADELPRTKVSAELLAGIEAHPDLVYASYGDRKMQLDLYRPLNAEGVLPAIVCIHGGGWQKGERRNHAHLAQVLADRGFVTVTISYRLSGEAQFPAQIHDCKAAVRWLRANAKKYGVDVGAIGATGLSAGGHLVALLAMSGAVEELEGDGGNAGQSSAIQAAVAMGAQSDLMTERIALRSSAGTGEIYRKFLGGSQADRPDLYRLASPRHHLDKADPPLAFVTGALDDPSTHAEAIRAEMKGFGIDSGLLVIADAPHPFLGRQLFFDQAVDFIEAFFQRHLK